MVQVKWHRVVGVSFQLPGSFYNFHFSWISFWISSPMESSSSEASCRASPPTNPLSSYAAFGWCRGASCHLHCTAPYGGGVVYVYIFLKKRKKICNKQKIKIFQIKVSLWYQCFFSLTTLWHNYSSHLKILPGCTLLNQVSSSK